MFGFHSSHLKAFALVSWFSLALGCGGTPQNETLVGESNSLENPLPLEVSLIGLRDPTTSVIVGEEETVPVQVKMFADISQAKDDSLLLPLGEGIVFLDSQVAELVAENHQVLVLDKEVAQDCLNLGCESMAESGKLVAVRSEVYDALPEKLETDQETVTPAEDDGGGGEGDRGDGPSTGSPPVNGGGSGGGTKVATKPQQLPKAGKGGRGASAATWTVGVRFSFGGAGGKGYKGTTVGYSDRNNSAKAGCYTVQGAETPSLWGILLLASLLGFGVHLERKRARRQTDFS